MKDGIRIGHDNSEVFSTALIDSVSRLLIVAHETRMEQQTIQAALSMIGSMTSINNINMSNLSITDNGQSKNDDGCRY